MGRTRRHHISVRLVGKPGQLSEEMRHILNSLDADCFPSDLLFKKDDCFWWAVYVNDTAAAFAGLRPQDDHFGFLCRAGVIRKFAGLGLQRRLIDARMRHARRIGLKGVTTYVAEHNWTSVANLIRCGLYITQMAAGFVSLRKTFSKQ